VGDLSAAKAAWEWLSPIVDVGVVAFLVYRTILLIRGTRALQMLSGLFLLIALFFLSKDQYFAWPTLNWLLDQFIASFIIILIVIFQDDIRRALSQVGRNPIVRGSWASEGGQFYEEIIRAVCALSSHRLGALLAIERSGDLRPYTDEAVRLDAEVSAELIYSVFATKQHNPLHDGAMIIQKGRVAYASCFLPLTVSAKVDRDLGTRHRAAIGLSEETDALVIVVSEETGAISVALGGALSRGHDAESLRHLMKGLFASEQRSAMWRRLHRAKGSAA
jgi:uncharacterized protein (TIGR00159 family)